MHGHTHVYINYRLSFFKWWGRGRIRQARHAYTSLQPCTEHVYMYGYGPGADRVGHCLSSRASWTAWQGADIAVIRFVMRVRLHLRGRADAAQCSHTRRRASAGVPTSNVPLTFHISMLDVRRTASDRGMPRCPAAAPGGVPETQATRASRAVRHTLCSAVDARRGELCADMGV